MANVWVSSSAYELLLTSVSGSVSLLYFSTAGVFVRVFFT